MSKKGKIILIISAIIIAIIAIFVGVYFYLLSSVSSGSTKVSFTVNQGDSKEVVAENLKNAKLIRSKYATLVYILISGKNNIALPVLFHHFSGDLVPNLGNGLGIRGGTTSLPFAHSLLGDAQHTGDLCLAVLFGLASLFQTICKHGRAPFYKGKS